jgi:hypothetical protein
MSARSVTVNFFNQLGNTKLLLVGSGLSHGEWAAGAQPPSVITPNMQVTWESDSDGVATGTQGWVRYYPVRAVPPSQAEPPPMAPDSETIYFTWDNPFVGSNSYSTSAPSPYILTYQGGSGDNAVPNVFLAGASQPNTCIAGYVWREAFPGDYVCVLPATRAQAAQDNALAASRIAATGLCNPGYVWREAGPNDHVCVTPETRAQTAADNAAFPQRHL